MTSRCKDIWTIQSEYRDNFFRLFELYFQKGIKYELIIRFIDEINAFWYKNIDFLAYEIEHLTENNLCLLLSGAIYLNVKESEHYYYKTFGNYHFLPDPFLKLESFFLLPKEKINLDETLGYFSRALQDTAEVLNTTNQHFCFLPMQLMTIENNDEQNKLIDTFFIRFLAKLCDQNLQSKEDFLNLNWNFETIEKKLSRNNFRLIFSEDDIESNSLREKVNNYIQTEMNIKSIVEGKTETEVFYICLYIWVSQVLNILLTCTYLRLQPYIRFPITFHYLTLIMYTFIEDNFLKSLIQKSIVLYVFRKSYNIHKLIEIDFDQYVDRTSRRNLLDEIIKEMEQKKINIFEGGIKKLETIIANKVKEIL